MKMNSFDRSDLTLITSVTGLLASLLLTSTAWGTERLYPLAPIISSFTLPHTIQTILFYVVFIGLPLSLLYKPGRKQILSIVLSSLAILVLLDNTRLQPWVFHYGAILLMFSAFVPGKWITQEKVLDAARIVVGGIYFWSGIQKMNFRFMNEIFPWFTKPLWESGASSDIVLYFVATLGILVPFIEAFFALGFFVKKVRIYAVLSASSMLVLVLASIGPTGHNWNSSVWPWNLAIFSFVLVLFWRTDFTLPEFIRRQQQNVLGLIMFALFWVMPIGSYSGLVDHYLAWSLYSGTVPEAALYGDQDFLETLSREARDGKLQVHEFSVDNINMVPYPEVRVFTAIFDQLCQQYPEQKLRMEIQTDFTPTAEPIALTCN
tara:strand:+ start:4834 stop:5961 length:1128 start_codon:yes stop_codon:yes gene_type:complete